MSGRRRILSFADSLEPHVQKEGPDDRSGLFTHAPENGRINTVRLTDWLSPPSHQYWGQERKKYESEVSSYKQVTPKGVTSENRPVFSKCFIL